MKATTHPPAPTRARKTRQKRSWTSVVLTLNDEQWRLWLTPAGLHARKRRSRRVWARTNVNDLVDFVTGQHKLPL